MADFDINAHLQRQGGSFAGGGGPGGDDVKANEDEIGQIVVAGAEKAIFTAAKAATSIPVLGWLIGALFPANPGKVSVFAGMESEGMAGKQIRVGHGGSPGGVLAKIAGELVKNSTITDHTAGVGGDSSGGGGGGSGGDGGGSGAGNSFESYASSSGMGEMFIEAGGGNRFAFTNFDPGDLGTLSPPIIGDMSRGGRGAGMEIG